MPGSRKPNGNEIITRAAVFLDRDGVINEICMDDRAPRPPYDISELRVGVGVAEALHRLRTAGFLLLVISNQPDISRGDASREAVERINLALSAMLPIDAIYYCPHDDKDKCECRKPKPGLVYGAARRWNIDLGRSCLVGDRWVDIAAAAAAGIDGILLTKDYSWNRSSAGIPPAHLKPRYVGNSLNDCVDFILGAVRYG